MKAPLSLLRTQNKPGPMCFARILINHTPYNGAAVQWP
jgi:hypothetical protein